MTFNNNNLTSLTNLNNNITYEYNADGIRIKKNVNGVTTSYKVFEGLIIEETIEGINGHTIKYLYDDSNLLLGFIYNNETYYYIRTLTGEISKIVNSDGIIVGEYIYDSYGNILNLDDLSSIAEINPFRYKGYYYDQESNTYYCKSRYYSPEIYRWISRDDVEYLDTSSVEGCNLYVYCNNNPIIYVDSLGNYPKKNDYLYNDFKYIFGHRNADGSWSLYDNDRFENKTPFHEQYIVFKGSKPSFNIKERTFGLGSISIDLMTAGWEWDKFDLSIFDFGHLELGLEFVDNELYASAFVSVWSPSVEFKIFGVSFELSFEVGAIGAELNLDNGEIYAKGAYGWGFGISIDW